VSFNVSVNQVTGQFEIIESGNLIGNGKGFIPAEGSPLEMDAIREKPPARDALKTMDQNEIYSLLALRGLEYGPVFQGIKECKTDGERCKADCFVSKEFCVCMCVICALSNFYLVSVARLQAAAVSCDGTETGWRSWTA
jgi:hypothetical protein